MSRRRLSTVAFLGLCLGIPAAAQGLVIGDRAPILAVTRWLARAPTPETGTPTLLVFLPQLRLPRRHADRALEQIASGAIPCRLIGVLTAAAAAVPQRGLAGIDLAVDGQGLTRSRYRDLFDHGETTRTALLSAQGELLWQGEFEASARHLVAAAADGRLDVGTARRLASLEASIVAATEPADWTELVDLGTAGVEEVPWHWADWVALIHSDFARHGRRRAAETVRSALAALRDQPAWAAQVLRFAAVVSAELAREATFGATMTELRQAAPLNPVVARAAFLVFAAVGDDAAASSAAVAYLEHCKQLPGELARWGQKLTEESYAGRFADAGQIALELALREAPDNLELLRRRFRLLSRHLRDYGGADCAGRRLVACVTDDPRYLNSFAWQLLTETPFRGKLNPLALHAARAMTKVEGWRAHWRIDTLALAEFENGHIDSAVRLQADAVEHCDAASRSRYEVRLKRYRAALVAATVR